MALFAPPATAYTFCAWCTAHRHIPLAVCDIQLENGRINKHSEILETFITVTKERASARARRGKSGCKFLCTFLCEIIFCIFSWAPLFLRFAFIRRISCASSPAPPFPSSSLDQCRSTSCALPWLDDRAQHRQRQKCQAFSSSALALAIYDT